MWIGIPSIAPVLGYWTGSGAAGVAGPYCVVASQVFVPGAEIAGAFVPGDAMSTIFRPGDAAQEIYGPGAPASGVCE